MKKIVLAMMALALLLPMSMKADGYTQLWKQVATAEEKDLPQTVMEILAHIETKASVERSYGNLLRAQLMKAKMQAVLSPDSLPVAVKRLETLAEESASSERVLAAVYETVLGAIYRDNAQLADDSRKISERYFERAMQKADVLVKQRDGSMEPFVAVSSDSRIFMHDLLHVVGFEGKAYQQLHDIYKARGNRSASCICALYMTREHRSDYGVELKKSTYVQKIDSLIDEYRDLPEAGELAIARYQAMEEMEDATAEDKYNYVNYALQHWGVWPRMNVLRNAQQRLTLPSFHVMLGEGMLLPGISRQIEVLGVTHLDQLVMSVRRLTVDGDTKLNPQDDADYQKLRKTIDPQAVNPSPVVKRYIGQPDYMVLRDTMMLEGLPVGVYLVEFTTNNSNVAVERALLRVTNVSVIHQTLPDRKIRLVAVDRATGRPIPECKIRLTTNIRGNQSQVNTLVTDRQGEVIYQYQNRQPDLIYAYTETDKASQETYLGGYFNYYDNNQSYSTASLFTDRRIYRPGQAVHVGVVTYRNIRHEDMEVEGGKRVKLSLCDANGKTISEKSVVTDDYGTASADFILPREGLTGIFTVRSDYGNRQTTSFSVEEYKRPAFEVALEDYAEKYVAGDTIRISGSARSYAGVPIQNALVNVKVTRKPAYFWWNRTNKDQEKVIKTDTLHTDADGNFSFPVEMLMPDGYDSRRPRYFSIVIEATVTDAAGETHESSLSLPLCDKSTTLTCDLPEKILKDSLSSIRFNYLNSAGQPIDAEISYAFDGGKRQVCKANESVSLPKQLSSGDHLLKAICGTDTLEQHVIVFSMTDKHPVIDTHDWFYVSSNEFHRDGSPVWVQVGSSDKDQHVVYTIISGKTVLESGVIDQSNALTTRQFKYDEAYGNGLLLAYAWVRDGKLYEHTAQIAKPLPDKRLIMEWTTFRDKLVPGQKEEWSLSIKRPDGKPADAQLMAAMYDKSLDQIRQHSWNFFPQLYLNLPSTRWYAQYNGTIGLYGEQPLKLLSEKSLVWSQIDESVFPSFYYYGRPRMLGSKQMMANTSVVELSAMSADAAPPMVQMAAKSADADAVEESKIVADDVAGSGQSTSETASQMRENLNETAFFYPALLADENGNVRLSFTLPESVTTWRMMGFAHDKNMCYGNIEGETVAQKTIMVQPNLPRFLRSGDQSQLTTRLFNTSEKEVSGEAKLQFIDPETEKVLLEQTSRFAVSAKESSSISFFINAASLPSLVICRVSASGKGYSDGEQHYLAILPDKQLVTNTQPFTQNEPGVKTIDVAKLFPLNDDSNKLTVEYTNNPSWLMIQALPSVASPDSKNAFSLSSALYANSIASYILHRYPVIKKTIELWQQEPEGQSLMSSLQKNEELKSLALSETPWLMDADKEADQKHQLIGFFDENAVSYRLSDEFSQLRKLQNLDGSFSWWPGMPGNRYVTSNVIETLVRLNKMGCRQEEAYGLIENGLSFLAAKAHEEVIELKKLEKKGQKNLRPSEWAVDYLYILSLHDDELATSVEADIDYLVSLLEKQTTSLTIYGKARAAIILAANHRTAKARELLQSLREYTVYKEETGRYFDTYKAQYSWRDYRIPTQVATIETLKALVPNDLQTIQEMQRWLLQSKRTQSWDTPVNAVDAVYAFMDGRIDHLTDEMATPSRLTVNGNLLDLPKATAGLGYVKTAITGKNLREFKAEKTSEGVSWGALYAQFMQPISDIEALSSDLSVKRELYVLRGSDYVLTDPSQAVLKTGDRVKVRITLVADRDYDFVQVVDQRAACLEPVSQLSGYQRGCYVTPRDASTNFYFDILAKGKHVVETEYFVDREGTYMSGTCTAQCAYSPEYMGRSEAMVLNVVGAE
ncbi:MAG: alpha-2-macroglobulin [Prevotella sp.]|nr:alpha-2-macroglobulin [Prevotella sp.]